MDSDSCFSLVGRIEDSVAAHEAIADIGVMELPSEQWTETLKVSVIISDSHESSALLRKRSSFTFREEVGPVLPRLCNTMLE